MDKRRAEKYTKVKRNTAVYEGSAATALGAAAVSAAAKAETAAVSAAGEAKQGGRRTHRPQSGGRGRAGKPSREEQAPRKANPPQDPKAGRNDKRRAGRRASSAARAAQRREQAGASSTGRRTNGERREGAAPGRRERAGAQPPLNINKSTAIYTSV